MISNFKKYLGRNLRAIQGYKTTEKLIIIESDDWGSIRMPSKEVYNKCLSDGYEVDKSPYTRFDGLERKQDLDYLCDILFKYRDGLGNHPIITTNYLISNPDFEKIRACNNSEYHFESFEKTYENYGENSITKTIKEAIDRKLIYPQSHGREHLNVSRFLKDLQDKKENAIYALHHNMLGIFPKIKGKKGNTYVCGFDYFDRIDEMEKSKIAVEGLNLFESFFGYKSKTFIAQNYIWGDDLESTLKHYGIELFQGSFIQRVPVYNQMDTFIHKKHFIGERKEGINYTCRNVYFEPSINENINTLTESLKQISIAFQWKKPAIVSSHRINFTSRLSFKNRDNNLKKIDVLLSEILKRWPDVKFITSEDLLKRITNKSS